MDVGSTVNNREQGLKLIGIFFSLGSHMEPTLNIFQGYHKGLPVIKLNAVCHEKSLSVDLLVTSMY